MTFWTAGILYITQSLPIKICDVRAGVKGFPIMRSTAELFDTPIVRFSRQHLSQDLQERKHLEYLAAEGRIK